MNNGSIEQELVRLKRVAIVRPQQATEHLFNLFNSTSLGDSSRLTLKYGVIKRELLAIILLKELMDNIKKENFNVVALKATDLNALQNRHCSDDYVMVERNGNIRELMPNDVLNLIEDTLRSL